VHRLYEADELYNRKTDPQETCNLAGQLAYADVERQLRDRMLDWLFETSDVIPWTPDPRAPRVRLPDLEPEGNQPR
jgi:hypothetical protein